MNTNDPIIGTETFPTFSLFAPRPVAKPGQALVMYRDNGETSTLMPGQRLTAGNMAWRDYKGYYIVDIGIHTLEFQTKVPCKKDAFSFEAKLHVTYYVKEPEVIVKNGIRDILAALRPEIENQMRIISRKYNPDQSKEAEEEINKKFEDRLQVNGILTSQIISNLELPPEAREHLHQIQSTENEIARQEITHKLEATKLNYENKLEATKLKHENELKKQRMNFYAPLIEKGQWNLLALQLTEHPEDVASIVNFINQQKQADRDNQLKLLKIMLEGDVVEGFNVDDVTRKTIQNLLEGLTPTNSNILIDGGSKNSPEKTVEKKKERKRKSKEKVEDSAETQDEETE